MTSNPITVTAPGSNSTNLYIASTNSLYLVPVDFTQPQLGAPVRLPYQPNSMVISNDGSSIYMGSAFELMTFSAVSNSLSGQDTSVTGSVLAVSPDGTTLVITDPIRQFVYFTARAAARGPGGTTSAGGIQTQFGGVGTHAVFSPDSQTVYITLGDYNSSTGVTTPNNQLLVHSQFTGWYQTTSSQVTTDVALGVPYVGAFFGGNPTTARSYCPVTTTVGGTATTSSTTTNVFYPDAGVLAPPTSRIATTNDGFHFWEQRQRRSPILRSNPYGNSCRSQPVPGLADVRLRYELYSDPGRSRCSAGGFGDSNYGRLSDVGFKNFVCDLYGHRWCGADVYARRPTGSGNTWGPLPFRRRLGRRLRRLPVWSARIT